MVSKTKSVRHKRFLEAGFFPVDLPPPFVSQDLATHRVAIEKALEKLPKKAGDKWYFRYVATPEVIIFPRPQRLGRQFTILNPINFFYLSREIANHWVDIKKHTKKSKCSVSNLVFDWDGNRTFLRPNFEAKSTRLRELSLEYPYLLHSDVSRYYHSIYTHAIPWALHSKIFAQANRSLKHLGNRLDTFVRNGQDGQTIGLPVGPDTSRVLAELLGVAIDETLCHADKRLKKSLIRFVDDVTAGAQNAEEAERVRNSIRKVLHGFQLEINEEKTQTLRVLSLDYGSWRHELHARIPRSNGALAKFELFFDLILRLSESWPRANVPVYALKQARRVFISADRWRAVEDFLLMIYRAHPVTLPVIVEILANRKLEKADIDVTKVSLFIRANIRNLADNDRLGEAAWMLFLAKILRIDIRVSDIKILTETNSSVCALLLCDLEVRGSIDGTLNKSHWNKSLTEMGLLSEMWLYAYEASKKGWTGQSDHFLATDPQFSELYTRQVSFYNENRNFLRANKKIELERKARKKEKIAFSQNLEEATLDLIDQFDTYEDESLYMTAPDEFYLP